ncbi:MAG: choice-of-anchor tandem repeat GloVer-containing protein, partial [Candidatus Cybelea sp.]
MFNLREMAQIKAWQLRLAVFIGAVTMLVGCGGSQPPIAAPGAIPQSRVSSGYGYNTLYSFGKRSSDGKEPKAALIDVNGTLYGTTFGGGSFTCGGCGTVFKIKPSGKETVLYRFVGGNDGANPSASLLAVKGVLYATTEYGGSGGTGEGTAFKIGMDGTEKVLHNFGPEPDGANPVASLIDVKGRLYGTTSNGGSNEYYGTVFSISTTGREKVLYSFGLYGDGANPMGNLLDVNGTLYGTTDWGGQKFSSYLGAGTVFGVSMTGSEKTLYAFLGEQYNGNGAAPEAGLVNVKGALYGTTGYGGQNFGGTAFS